MTHNKAYGRRAVQELLDTGLKVLEIFLLAGGHGRDFKKLVQRAEAKSVRVIQSSRKELDRIASGVTHQGVIAFYQAPQLLPLDELLTMQVNDAPRPIIILDGIEDPHNLGAIIRTAEVFGSLGVVIRHRRAAGLSPVAVKVSAGGALRLPIAEVTNIEQSIKALKEDDYWVYGLDPGGDKDIWEMDLSGRTAFVLGSEGKGLGRLVKNRCDSLIRIHQVGKVASLNVSVSAGVILAEWLRQKNKNQV